MTSSGQLQKAITTRAIPVLEFLAEHPNYLEQTLNRRFDRDDPPQYESYPGLINRRFVFIASLVEEENLLDHITLTIILVPFDTVKKCGSHSHPCSICYYCLV
jgi:hypothetical protein